MCFFACGTVAKLVYRILFNVDSYLNILYTTVFIQKDLTVFTSKSNLLIVNYLHKIRETFK